MALKLTPVNVFPTGMRLNEYVALEEGFFLEEGLEVEILWDVLRGQMVRRSDTYKERPQDRPFVDGEQTIGSACAWGSISNAGAGMGKFVPDVHGVSPWGIFVRPDSAIRKPEDLKDVPIAVGLRAGSHFNVPYRLEKYLPLDNIKPVNVGGFGARLKALVDGEFKTLWWVDERWDAETLRAYFRALDKVERAITADTAKYLPLSRYSNPPEFGGHDGDYGAFSRGERFVHAPIDRAEYDEWMDGVRRWKMDDFLQESDFEKLAMSVG